MRSYLIIFLTPLLYQDLSFLKGGKVIPAQKLISKLLLIGYNTDVLQNLEVLAALGQAENPKLANALDLVISKQNPQGRWLLEHTYNGKTWVDIEKKGQPSK